MKVLQPRRLEPRKLFLVLFVLIAFTVYTWLRPPPRSPHPSWAGETMGTTYHITLADSALTAAQLESLRLSIDQYLRHINDLMSTYRVDTEISRFNQSRSTEPLAVSPELARVVRYSLDLCLRTGGRFDPTLDPLINLWGFGHRGHPDKLPDAEAVRRTLAVVGHTHLRVTDGGALQKDIPDLQLNLGGIAPGFAVDEIVGQIQAAGVSNLFVELGGECLVAGHSPRGDPWKIGIDVPAYDAGPGEAIEAILHLSRHGVSTSGDYRHYVTSAGDGKIYSHILDPQTGYPVQHKVASVTVIAPTCMEADGLSTALFVMGDQDGLAWLAGHPGAEALFIVRDADGTFTEEASPGFAGLTGYTH